MTDVANMSTMLKMWYNYPICRVSPVGVDKVKCVAVEKK